MCRFVHGRNIGLRWINLTASTAYATVISAPGTFSPEEMRTSCMLRV